MRDKAATTVSVGVLAAVAAYVTETLLVVPTWVAFLAWASFHSIGSGSGVFVRSIAANLAGLVIGSMTLLAIYAADHRALLSAVAVGIGSAIVVQVSRVSTLAAVPAIFFGFSCTVGTVAVTGRPITTTGIDSPVVIAATALVLGNVFGLLSERLAELLRDAGFS